MAVRRNQASVEAEGYTVARMCSWMGSADSSPASPVRNDKPFIYHGLDSFRLSFAVRSCCRACARLADEAFAPHKTTPCGKRVEMLCRGCVDSLMRRRY